MKNQKKNTPPNIFSITNGACKTPQPRESYDLSRIWGPVKCLWKSLCISSEISSGRYSPVGSLIKVVV